MANYKATTNPGFVIRTADGAAIPVNEPTLPECQVFLAWQAAGGVPDAVPPLTKAQKITAMNAKYAPQFQALQLGAGAALLIAIDFPSLLSSLATVQQQNSDLKAQKSAEQAVILSGG